jgi:prevent-host-death family protein
VRVTATEASRGFSELLSRVASGETVEIDRHGQVVAVVSPPPRLFISGAEFLDLLDNLPRPDPGFADDVEGIDEVLEPYEDPWQS